MATKYQCEKAIKKLAEINAQNPNVQGYGIGRARDFGMDKDVGFLIVVYTAEAPKKITKIEKLEDLDTKKQPKDKAASKMSKKPQTTKNQSKNRNELENSSVHTYPDKAETTSRSKKIQVPLEYVETGAFGIG